MSYLVDIKFRTFDNNFHFITLDADEIYFNEKRDTLGLYNVQRKKGSISYAQFLNMATCLKAIKMQGNYIEIDLNKSIVDIEVKDEKEETTPPQKDLDQLEEIEEY